MRRAKANPRSLPTRRTREKQEVVEVVELV